MVYCWALHTQSAISESSFFLCVKKSPHAKWFIFMQIKLISIRKVLRIGNLNFRLGAFSLSATTKKGLTNTESRHCGSTDLECVAILDCALRTGTQCWIFLTVATVPFKNSWAQKQTYQRVYRSLWAKRLLNTQLSKTSVGSWALGETKSHKIEKN